MWINLKNSLSNDLCSILHFFLVIMNEEKINKWNGSYLKYVKDNEAVGWKKYTLNDCKILFIVDQTRKEFYSTFVYPHNNKKSICWKSSYNSKRQSSQQTLFCICTYLKILNLRINGKSQHSITPSSWNSLNWHI